MGEFFTFIMIKLSVLLLLIITITVTPAYAINTTEFTIIDSIRNDGTACLGFVNLPAGSTSVSLLYNGNSQNTTYLGSHSDPAIFTDGMTCQSGTNNRLAGEYQYYAGGSEVYSNAIVLSEYKREPPTLSGSVTVSTQSGNTYTEQIPQEPLIPDITVDVTDNKVEGITTNTDKHIVITTISPSSEVDNKIIKPDNNGTYSADLNPSEPGEHIVYVTQDTKTVQTTHSVEEDEVDLEIRLQILQTLQRILEIIFGK